MRTMYVTPRLCWDVHPPKSVAIKQHGAARTQAESRARPHVPSRRTTSNALSLLCGRPGSESHSYATANSASTRFADADEVGHVTTDAGYTVTTADSVVQLGYTLPHGLVESSHGDNHIGVNAWPLLDR